MNKLSLIEKKFQFISYEKSDVFFLKKKKLLTSRNIFDLAKIGIEKKKDLKICMHRNINDELHNMINFLYKKKNYSPHKHDVDEVYQFIDGNLKIILFDKKFHVKEIFFLNKKNPIIRILKNTYHLTIPTKLFSIFHEIKKGPFNKKKTIISNKIYYTKNL